MVWNFIFRSQIRVLSTMISAILGMVLAIVRVTYYVWLSGT